MPLVARTSSEVLVSIYFIFTVAVYAVAAVSFFYCLARFDGLLHQIVEQVAGNQERNGGTDSGGYQNYTGSHGEAEYGATNQRQYKGTGNGGCCDKDVNCRENNCGEDGIGFPVGIQEGGSDPR